MRKIYCIFISMIFAFSYIAGCAGYPEYGGVEIQDENVRVKVEFGENDRRLIHQYYAGKHKERKKMPPGLAKKKELPPGLQKQLVKRGKLPPGLEGRFLPPDLERQLSPLPGGYIRMSVGGDIVLLDRATRAIADIIYDIE